MKRLLPLAFFVCVCIPLCSNPLAGFYLPEWLNEFSMRYKSVNNLVILPVTINDSVKVNLILDTGCRNLVLFGKRFTHRLHTDKSRLVPFSGMGKGKPVEGLLSIENSVEVGAVKGKRIPVIVVPSRNLFAQYDNVDGVIGYELFSKFEIEINFAEKVISFRPGLLSEPRKGYQRMPMRVEDSKPVIDCSILFNASESDECSLIIDTGSVLGLLLTTSEQNRLWSKKNKMTLGTGLNGLVQGKSITSKKVTLGECELNDVDTGIIFSNEKHYASIGTHVLKDYILVLNYCKSYAAIKRNTIHQAIASRDSMVGRE